MRYKTDKLYTGINAGDFRYNALVRKEDGVRLGLMGFQKHANDGMDWLLMPNGSRNVEHIPGVLDVELTYALGKSYWRQGYAAEAGRAMIDYGFTKLGIDRIINAISPDNIRSRNLMLRLGFTFLDSGNPEDIIGVLERSRTIPTKRVRRRLERRRQIAVFRRNVALMSAIKETSKRSDMVRTIDVFARLHSGHEVVAEVPAPHPEMRSFVIVIPRVPNIREHPEAWIRGFGQPTLRDAASISGYEVRYFLLHEKYTDTEWGWDYDYVLDDETTRVKRVFVQTDQEIEGALSPWSVIMAELHDPGQFDSSLVNSPIDSYLDRPAERPHLWRD